MNVARYAVVIVPLSEEDGGGYAAHVPDLPGCMSDGETQEEAVANARDAIVCWMEANAELGRDAPEPGDTARRCHEREQALFDALRAALDYADHADGRIAVLEQKVEALAMLMRAEDTILLKHGAGAVVARLAAPC
jgi:predicted RNase H-like HicB family nuclease